MMDKAVLNEAILRVLLTPFKKYMDGYDKIVEEAGYNISKWNGCWHVKNPKTGRTIWVSGDYAHWLYNNGSDNSVRFYANDCKVDLVGMLNKPINYEWRWVYWNRGNIGCTNFAKKKGELRDAKWSVKYEQGDIESIKKNIADLTAKLETAIRYKVQAEIRLEKVRKELGLRK